MIVNEDKLNELKERLKPQKCQLCGERSWIMTNKIFYMNEFHKDEVVLGGTSFPVLPIICSNCGNTIFLNAMVAKLLDEQSNNSDGAEE